MTSSTTRLARSSESAVFGRRPDSITRVAEDPGVLGEIDNLLDSGFQCGIKPDCLLAQLPQIVRLLKRLIVPHKKGLQGLLDGLLAMKDGIFWGGRLCRQVYLGVSQIV
jgi:hypothetical protein